MMNGTHICKNKTVIMNAKEHLSRRRPVRTCVASSRDPENEEICRQLLRRGKILFQLVIVRDPSCLNISRMFQRHLRLMYFIWLAFFVRFAHIYYDGKTKKKPRNKSRACGTKWRMMTLCGRGFKGISVVLQVHEYIKRKRRRNLKMRHFVRLFFPLLIETAFSY